MSDYALLVISAALVNNLVLTRSLGLCALMSGSRSVEISIAVALATSLTLILCTAVNYLIDAYLLRPLTLEYLRTMIFIVVVAATAPLNGLLMRAINPTLHDIAGAIMPLIGINSAALGVTLLNARAARGFFESMLYGFGGALGVSLVLILFTVLRERVAAADVPEAFRGSAIDLITLGLMSLGFMGFVNLAKL
ncbi:MAG: electron transport complex subunit RsxA [Pseudomonadota bacterium]|nr:electron transport complex subunit RsxA [Pseudomonadota bacterium]